MSRQAVTPARAAALSAGWLAAFAVVFSAGSALGAWPVPPEGFLSGSDLAAGLVFGAVLLASLARPGLRFRAGRAPVGRFPVG